MQPPETADGALLAAEAGRYLAAVEAFRREGYEPHWEAEGIRRMAGQLCSFAPRVGREPSERSKRC